MAIIASLSPESRILGKLAIQFGVRQNREKSREKTYFSSRIKYSERSDAHSEILTMSRELLE